MKSNVDLTDSHDFGNINLTFRIGDSVTPDISVFDILDHRNKFPWYNAKPQPCNLKVKCHYSIWNGDVYYSSNKCECCGRNIVPWEEYSICKRCIPKITGFSWGKLIQKSDKRILNL